MGRKIIPFYVAVLILLGATAFSAAEEIPWHCLYGEWFENDAHEYLFTLYQLDVSTGEGEALASFPNFHAWSAAADETRDTVLVAGFDLKADKRFVCYRLAGSDSTRSAEKPEVILEFNGATQPQGDVIFDPGEGVFYVGAEGVSSHANSEKYRDTILYRYEPAAGPPVELARLGRHVSLTGEADDDRIYVFYDGETSYGRRRIYGYVDKNTFNVVPLGIFPDYFGGEPTRYVPYGGPEGAGQLLPGAPAAVAGPRAYVYDTAQVETNDERTICLRDAASPGGYREVNANGTPGRILYSRSRDALVYLLYPPKAEETAYFSVTYPDGMSVETVSVPTPEAEAGETRTPYDYGLLYVE